MVAWPVVWPPVVPWPVDDVSPSTAEVHCVASTHAPAGRPVTVMITGMPSPMPVAGSSVTAAAASGAGPACGVVAGGVAFARGMAVVGVVVPVEGGVGVGCAGSASAPVVGARAQWSAVARLWVSSGRW
jgi:hypothetical protein